MRILLSILILSPFAAQAQDVYFHFTDGTSSTFPIEQVRSTDFSGNSMRLFLWDGTSHEWDLAEIDRYQFNDISTSIANEANSPIQLQGIFPNPSKGEINIGFHLEGAGEVLIEIYDARGSLIATVDHRHFPRGEHTVLWNGSDADGSAISNGSYVCRIVQGANITSKTLIIER